jgi:hypothetical protein
MIVTFSKRAGLLILTMVLTGLFTESLYADATIQNVRLSKETDGTRVDFDVVIYNLETYVFQAVIEWKLVNREKAIIHNLVIERCMPVGQQKFHDKIKDGEVEKVLVYFEPRPQTCIVQ